MRILLMVLCIFSANCFASSLTNSATAFANAKIVIIPSALTEQLKPLQFSFAFSFQCRFQNPEC